jgi:hypothetical protein
VDYLVSFDALGRQLGVNALAYRGFSVVNASFKGISGDVLWPDERLFYGRTRVPRQLVESDAGLDLLSIRYVLALTGEPVAPGLRQRGALDIEPETLERLPGAVGVRLVVYENPDAWPSAFLIDGLPADLPDLPEYAECANNRMLCRDLAPLARLRADDRLQVAGGDGRFHIDMEASVRPRVLIVTEMFRPEWIAETETGPADTLSVGPGLLGVVLPAGTTEVRLAHRNARWAVSTLLAWSVVVGSVAVIVLLTRQRARTAAGGPSRTVDPQTSTP